jgi:hypothetical protein
MKAEWLSQGSNSRFVVTNFSMNTRQVYKFYKERGGTCEVRIDKFKKMLKSRLTELPSVFCQSVSALSAYGCLLAIEAQRGP